MSIDVGLESLDALGAEWMDLVRRGQGATGFHETECLAALGVSEILTVRERGRLRAGQPCFGDLAAGRLTQSSLSVPYGGPVFAASSAHVRRRLLQTRQAAARLASALQSRFEQVVFCLAPDVHDLVPWLEAGFLPEVRYTYRLDTGAPSALASGRRNDKIRAARSGLEAVEDRTLRYFDVKRSVQWATETGFVPATRDYLSRIIAADRGCPWVAVSGARPVAGLFMQWDAHHGYTTHSYMIEAGRACGAATFLYLHALSVARARGLEAVDLSGSVLPGVERFYQSFGARQTLYFRLHWYADPSLMPGVDLYQYD